MALLIAVVAITAGATTALRASTLTVIPIPSWLPGTNENQGRAISPDGKYVVGAAGTHAYSGFFYDVANDTVIQPNGGGSVPSLLTGIAYRTDPVSSEQQLILDGVSAVVIAGGVQANWMTTDGGATWGAKRRDTSFTQANTLPAANSLGAVEGQDAFYQTIRNSSDTQIYVNQGSNNWTASIAPAFNYSVKGIPSGDSSAMNGVAASGRAVGRRKTATIGTWKNNYILDWNGTGTPTPWYLINLVGTTEGRGVFRQHRR